MSAEFIIDPEAQLHTIDRQNINTFLSDHPEVPPAPYISQYSDRSITPRDAARMLTKPELVNTRENIKAALAENMHELVSTALPHLTKPGEYDQKEAQQIVDLSKELNALNRNTSSNPFERLVSLKHLARLSGATIEDIRRQEKKPFKFGSLQVEVRIEDHSMVNEFKLRGNIVKRARRDSVHGSDSRGRLKEPRIEKNVDRIRNERRMIKVTPSVATSEVVIFKG